MTTKAKPAFPQKDRSNGARRQITLRNDFYRDGFRLLVIALPLMALLLLAAGLAIYHLLNRPADRTYFTIDQENRVVKIVGLREPFITDSKLLEWVSERVVRSTRLDPLNLVAQVNDLRPDYTKEGFEGFQQALVDSGTVEMMQRKVLVMSGTLTGSPVIIKQGVEAGVYTWRVRMPMVVDFKSAAATNQRKRVVDVVVVRRHTIENPSGIAISQSIWRDV